MIACFAIGVTAIFLAGEAFGRSAYFKSIFLALIGVYFIIAAIGGNK